MLQLAYPSFTWLNPTRVIFGAGKLGDLPSGIDDVAGAGSRVFLVTGRRSLRERGILRQVLDHIGPNRVTHFDQVDPFPSTGLCVGRLGPDQ